MNRAMQHALRIWLLAASAACLGVHTANAVVKYYTEYLTASDYASAFLKGEKSTEHKGFTYNRAAVGSGNLYNYSLRFTYNGITASRYAFYKPIDATGTSGMPATYVRITGDDTSSGRRYFYSNSNCGGGKYSVPGGSGYSASSLEVLAERNGWDTSEESTGGIVMWQDCHIDYLCTITFGAGGGTGTMPSQTFENHGVLSANAFKRTGYSFTGWKDSSGEAYADKASVGSDEDPLTTDLSLTAQWTQNVYTVTFDATGGTTPQSSRKVSFGAEYGSLPMPTRAGYAFAGWYTAASGGTQVTATTKVSVASSHRLYAQWTGISYVLRLHRCLNQNDTATAGRSMTYGQARVLPTVAELGWSKTGYAFAGWATNANAAVAYADGQSVSNVTTVANSEAHIYAKWAPNKYYLRLYRNSSGIDTAYARRTLTYDTARDLPTVAELGWSKTGYTFAGWATNVNTAVKYTDGQSVKNLSAVADDEVCVYAKWTAASYRVTLDRRSGSGGMTSVTATYDAVMPTVTVPERTGYTFAGYYGSVSGGSKYCNADGTGARNWTKAGDGTLYAHWTAKAYTVSFDANGGSVSPASKSVTYDSTYGDMPVPERTGYTFAGWWTSPNGGTRIETATKVSITAAQTLYAHWTAKAYTVSFDANGGSVSTTSKSVTYDSTYGSLPTPTRTGYTFAGWYTAASGGTRVETTTQVSITAAQTLYAHWTARTYTVSFSANGGSVSPAEKTVTYDSTYGDMPVPERTGYTFAGWWTLASGGTQVKTTTKVATTSSQTLYAHWTAKAYKVTFNANGGSVSPASKSVTYDSTYGELPVPERAGYTFAGWYTAKSGGTQVHESSSVRITSGQTLYAHWTANRYTIELNTHGAISGGGEVTVTYGETPRSLTVPEYNDNHVFAGYWTGENGTGERFWDELGQWRGGVWTNTDVRVVHAKKNGIPYYIEYSANGGGGDVPAKQTCNTSHAVTLATGDGLERDGHRLLGWDQNSGAANPKFACGAANVDASAFSGLANGVTIVLYATWRDVRVDLPLDAAGGSCATNAVSVVPGEPYGELPTPEKEGYGFAGWQTDGGETVTAESIVADGVASLTAQWTACVYAASFDPGEGSVDPSGKEVTFDAPYGDLPVPELQKHAFLGWFLGADPASQVTAETVVSTPSNHVLRAAWSNMTFAVAFDANGGSVDGASVTNIAGVFVPGVPYGADMPIPSHTNTVDATGATNAWKFAGWWTSTNPVGRVQHTAGTAASTAVATLYARWKDATARKTYTVTLDGGARGGTNYVYRKEGDILGALDPAVSADGGYRFAWWCDEYGRPVSEETELQSDVVLKARWSRGVFNDFTGIGASEIAFEPDDEGSWTTGAEHQGRSAIHCGRIGETGERTLTLYLSRRGAVTYRRLIRDSKFVNPDEDYKHVYLSCSLDGSWSDSVWGVADPDWQAAGAGSAAEEKISFTYSVDGVNDATDDTGVWLADLGWSPAEDASQLPEWKSATNGVLSVVTGGTEKWKVVSDEGECIEHNGIATATNLPHARTSWVRVAPPGGPGVLTFAWRVSSEAGYIDTNGVYRTCDYLELCCETGRVMLVDGLMDGFEAVALTNATDEAHVFTWRYVKDGDVDEGLDRAFLDFVEWTPLGGGEPAAEFTTVEYVDLGGVARTIAVPNAWADEYDLLAVTGAPDYETALMAPSGKGSLSYWHDYLALTNPTNTQDVFAITAIEVVDGAVRLEWSPDHSETPPLRVYTVYGKTNLLDAAWHTPTNSASRFFRVEVGMPPE